MRIAVDEMREVGRVDPRIHARAHRRVELHDRVRALRHQHVAAGILELARQAGKSRAGKPLMSSVPVNSVVVGAMIWLATVLPPASTASIST